MPNLSFLLIFKAAFLGIIEGLTEFIPVSSTAHLLLAARFIDFSADKNHFFEIGIQFGAILAVLVFYRQRLLKLIRNCLTSLHQAKKSNQLSAQKSAILKSNSGSAHASKIRNQSSFSGWNFVLSLIIAFLPAAIIGFFLHDLIKSFLFSKSVIACALIIGGILMILVEKFCKKQGFAEILVEEIPWKIALKIGFFQCLAMIPGFSRSGSTIIGAMFLGVNRIAAIEFSFFLAIPTISAACLYDFYKNFHFLNKDDFLLLAVGLSSSFISSILVIKWLLNYVAKHDFTAFALYRIILGIILISFII